MSASSTAPIRTLHLRLISELFPGLRSPEMRGIIADMTEKRLRRARMDREDRANAIRLPSGSQRSVS